MVGMVRLGKVSYTRRRSPGGSARLTLALNTRSKPRKASSQDVQGAASIKTANYLSTRQKPQPSAREQRHENLARLP